METGLIIVLSVLCVGIAVMLVTEAICRAHHRAMYRQLAREGLRLNIEPIKKETDG